MQQSTQPHLRDARIVAGSLAAGVALFWIVGWLKTSGGEVGIAPDAVTAELAFWIWAGAAILGFAAALAFRGRALRIVERSTGEESGPPIGELRAVQTNLVISWALLEGPALLSAVFYLLTASERILWAAVPVYAIGVAVTFPRAEWFGEGRGLMARG
ncbi:MAG TPA: hypothetical protein VF212_06465 [Longimicrobiales bacterium]